MTLDYDPLGRLRQTTTSSVATEFLYDGDALSAEYVSAAIARRYVHGPGVDEPIVWYEGSGLSDRRYMIADHQGSIIAANGATTTRYTYGPYGEPGAWAGARFRYTGQAALPEVALYHYKARVYDPVLGRFLQTDPVKYEDGYHLYAYTLGDPINRYDPTGMLSNCRLDEDRCAAIAESERRAVEEAKKRRSDMRAATGTGRIASAARDRLNEYFGYGAGPAVISFVDRVLAAGIKASDEGEYTFVPGPENGAATFDGRRRQITVPSNATLDELRDPKFAGHEVLAHGGLHSFLGGRGFSAGGQTNDSRPGFETPSKIWVSPYDWRAVARNYPSMAFRNAENYACYIVGCE